MIEHAEARYLIARANRIAVSRECVYAPHMDEGEHHWPAGQFEPVKRVRTERRVPVPAPRSKP